MTQQIQRITQKDDNFPVSIRAYLAAGTPETLWARGNIDLFLGQHSPLKDDLWALFCSSRCPGEIILKAHDLAQEFKEASIPTIGGFHSSIEAECLRVLLRGTQPILLCPARGIETMRLKKEWKKPFSDGRLLILSIFDNHHKRPTVARTLKRNAFVAALASKILIAHAAEGSKTLEFAETILKWDKPVFTFDSPSNKALLQLGVQPLIGGKQWQKPYL